MLFFRFSYSVLAATALGIVMGDRALAAAVSGHEWTSFSVGLIISY